VSTVVFDLGEVLASPTTLYAELADHLPAGEREVEDAYWRGRDAHDRGASATEYWSGVITALGGPIDADLVARLSLIDAVRWTTIRQDAADTLRDLSVAGLTVAVLSNAPVELGRVARSTPWAKYVGQFFFSGDLRLAKPDAEIYELVTQRLDVPPEEVVFFDDRQVNVDAARNAGWDAYLWTSGGSMRETLEALRLL